MRPSFLCYHGNNRGNKRRPKALLHRRVGTEAARDGEIAGSEWTQRHTATVTVHATVITLFSELGVTTQPTTALYDASFGWRFAFQLR